MGQTLHAETCRGDHSARHRGLHGRLEYGEAFVGGVGGSAAETRRGGCGDAGGDVVYGSPCVFHHHDYQLRLQNQKAVWNYLSFSLSLYLEIETIPLSLSSMIIFMI